jgi:hypothetical protein
VLVVFAASAVGGVQSKDQQRCINALNGGGAHQYLTFERGPTTDVRLQWATYFDASDQAGQSRLWGGIHISADDFVGRTIGSQVGTAAYAKALQYFDGTLGP